MLILDKKYVYKIKKNHCPKCESNSVIHYGKQNGKFRFQCKSCLKVFQPKDQSWVEQAYSEFTEHKQTYPELEVKYNKDENTIRKYFDQLGVEARLIQLNSLDKLSESVVQSNLELVRIGLIFDTTFFKRRFGVMVYRSGGKNLKCSFVPTERLDYYLNDLRELSKQYCFTSFTIDGRKGLIQLLQKHFPNTPIQICHFHQVAIVTRYTTRNPKTSCGAELLILIKTLKTRTKETFIRKFNNLQIKYKDFLKERNEQGQFQHRKLRSAIRSIKFNLPYLFTFQDHKDLKIESTTNSCEGSFGQWKYKVRLHRGMTDDRMQQMIRRLLGCP